MMAQLKFNHTTVGCEIKHDRINVNQGNFNFQFVMQRLSQPQAHQLKDVKATPKPGSNKQERGFVKVGRKANGKRKQEWGVKGQEGGQEWV